MNFQQLRSVREADIIGVDEREIQINVDPFRLEAMDLTFYDVEQALMGENVNIGAGGVFGYETVNKGEKNLSNGALITSRPGFIFGAFLGLDIDYSISDKLSLVLKANQYYHANSNLGEFVPFVGLGLKYYTD